MRIPSNTFSRSKIFILSVCATVFFTTYFVSTAEAREGRSEGGSNSSTVLALDLDYVTALSEPASDSGGCGALRIGRKLDLILISLTPEIGGSYNRFNGSDDVRIYRGFIGGRLGLGKILEPSAFAHIGIGRLDANVVDHTAPVFDAGIALDFTLLPLINVGAQGSYNTLLAQGEHSIFNWLAFGLHVAFVF